MATQKTIDETVDKLSILQRSSLSELELAVVKQEWRVTFAEVPDQDFITAARKARLRKPFFPAEADIVAELRMMSDERKERERQDEIRRQSRALPAGRASPEYLAKVRHNVALIKDRLRANMDVRPRDARSGGA